MAIQFYCTSCSKPIEIDDDAANQPVTCPYCQALVTAPGVSDPAFQSSAVVQPAEPGEPLPPPPLPPMVQARGNKLSWASLICIVVAGAGYLTSMTISANMLGKVEGPITPEQLSKRVNEEIKQRPALAAPLMAGSAAACVLPIVGFVLAIIAITKRRPPLWPAITTICLASIAMILTCGSLLALRMPGGQ